MEDYEANQKRATLAGGPWHWWRWRESNPRPTALHPRHYMLSSPLDLVPRQHGVRSAPGTQSVTSTTPDWRPPRLVPVMLTLHPLDRDQQGSGLTPYTREARRAGKGCVSPMRARR